MTTTCSPPSTVLAGKVGSGCGENAYKCYQCKKCSTGCPVAPYTTVHPAMIMRAVQLGQLDLVFNDKFIWLCTGCETCTTRCPQGIDIAAIIDELKIIARDDGSIPSDAPFADTLRLNYESIKRWGRLYEVELIARGLLKRPKGALDYMSLGPKMMLKGKVSLLPERGDTAAMKRMVETAESITRAKKHAAQGGAS